MPGRRCRWGISGNPTWNGPNSRGNRPILVLLMPLFCLLQLPSASASFRQLPPDSVLGRFRPLRPTATCLYGWAMTSGGIFGNPSRHGPNFGENLPILGSFRPFPAPAIFSLIPPASVSGRSWPMRQMATCLYAWVAISGGHFWKPNMECAKFRGESANSSSA